MKLGKPSYIFKNSKKRKIYCWNLKKDYIFSLNRLDEEEGKYSSINKSDKSTLKVTLKKLGLGDVSYKKLIEEKLIMTKKQSGFYNEIPTLRESRLDQQKAVLNRTGKSVNPTKKVNSNIKELGFLAGVNNADFNNPIQEETKPQKMYDKRARINHKKKKVSPERLTEGKADRVILGKTSVTAQSNGLYKIEIDNVPAEEKFDAELYSAVIGFLNDKLEGLKQSNPDVAAYEQATEGELAGKADEQQAGAGAGEVDLGFEEPPAEGGEMAPMGAEAPMAGAGEAAVGGATGEGAMGVEAPATPTPVG